MRTTKPNGKAEGLEPPVVRLVMPGVFEHWMRHQGKWGGQNKMPRCRSDREVADQLAQADPLREGLTRREAVPVVVSPMVEHVDPNVLAVSNASISALGSTRSTR